MIRWATVRVALLLCFGIVFLGGGITLVAKLKSFVLIGVHSQLPVISNQSRLWKYFVTPTDGGVTVRSFTFLNVTNPYDVCNGTPPILHPVGPYTYIQSKTKIVDSIYWSADKNEVHYEYVDDFVFSKKDSIDAHGRQLSEEDVITLYNTAFFGVVYRLTVIDPNFRPPSFEWFTLREDVAMVLQFLMNTCITPKNQNPDSPSIGIIQQQTANEYLWGYKDPLWTFLTAEVADFNVTFYSPTMSRFQFNHTIPVPEPISSLTGQRCPMWDNVSVCNSTTNRFTIQKTGNGNIKEMGILTQWAGNTNLSWWEEGCQSLGPATDGTQFKPGITIHDRPTIMGDAIWRPVELQFSEFSSVKGVDTLRFVLSPESLQSGEQHPPNKCYRQHREGFINMSVPLYAPLLVSKPYYLDANVTGLLNFTLKDGKPMIPDRSLHDTIVDIEPFTGKPFQASVKVQVNMEVGVQETSIPWPFAPQYEITKNLTKTMVPLLYAEDNVVISDDLVTEFKSTLMLYVELAKGGAIILVVFGLAMIVRGTYLYRRKVEDDQEDVYQNLNSFYPKGSGV